MSSSASPNRPAAAAATINRHGPAVGGVKMGVALTLRAVLGAAALAVAGSGLSFHVDCDAGSDTGPGTAAHPFRTLEAARDAVRRGRGEGHTAAASTARVTVRGHCYATLTRPNRPLELTKRDNLTEWRGAGDGATISGGAVLRNWSSVSWPGARAGSVIRASIAHWPIPVRSLRYLGPDAADSPRAAVPMARFPPQQPSNYSAGWLTTAAWTPTGTGSWFRNSSSPRPMQLVGLRPEDFPSPEIYSRKPSDLYVNIFQSAGEKDGVPPPPCLASFGHARRLRNCGACAQSATRSHRWHLCAT